MTDSAALLATGDWPHSITQTWRQTKIDRAARHAEYPLERAVSQHIAKMPLIWLPVHDRHQRGRIERNSIALLSCRTGGTDRPLTDWLGHYAHSQKVRTSGLWNANHVDEHHDSAFLDELEHLIDLV